MFWNNMRRKRKKSKSLNSNSQSCRQLHRLLLINLLKNGNRSCLWQSDGEASQGGYTESINRAGGAAFCSTGGQWVWEGKKRGSQEEKGGAESLGWVKLETGEKVRELAGEGYILGVSGTLDPRYLKSRSWTVRTISECLAGLRNTLCWGRSAADKAMGLGEDLGSDSTLGGWPPTLTQTKLSPSQGQMWSCFVSRPVRAADVQTKYIVDSVCYNKVKKTDKY